MKRKAVLALITYAITVAPLMGCENSFGQTEDTPVENLSSEYADEGEVGLEEEVESEQIQTIEEDVSETETVTQSEVVQETSVETQIESELTQSNEIKNLSQGELEARKIQQANFEEAREAVYIIPNSKDKTIKINQMDRQILANNAYDFSDKNIVFIGDSITEGIAGAVTSDNKYVSYTNYVQSYLHFNTVLNHGKGGRMFADYGGEELSLDYNFGNVTNIGCDIFVVFAGVNDYLSAPENKRFGNVDDTLSTAGYCGAVRSFMKQLKMYYSDRDIFFVMMYDINRESSPTYSDVTGELSLNDYLDVQRQLAKEYGFNIIDLYSVGFMDCTDYESEEYFLNDALHPNDTGNIVLGEHIAAELSLYYSQK